MNSPAQAIEHGTYAAYSNKLHPCRCDACRKAKADYMRERRDAARAATGDKSADDFRHGTRYGYEERGCRCDLCVTARRTTGVPKSLQMRYRCKMCRYLYAFCTCPGGPRGAVA